MKSPIHILIVDDEEAIRISLQVYFEDRGFVIHDAPNSESALEIMERYPIDLAVVDLRLPAMNGVMLIRMAHKQWPKMSFIIFTGSLDYAIPKDMVALPQISDTVFYKPLKDMELMYKEVCRLLNGTDNNYEQ